MFAVGLNIRASHVLVLTEGLNFLASWRIPRAHRWPELPGQLAGGAARVRGWAVIRFVDGHVFGLTVSLNVLAA